MQPVPALQGLNTLQLRAERWLCLASKSQMELWCWNSLLSGFLWSSWKLTLRTSWGQDKIKEGRQFFFNSQHLQREKLVNRPRALDKHSLNENFRSELFEQHFERWLLAETKTQWMVFFLSQRTLVICKDRDKWKLIGIVPICIIIGHLFLSLASWFEFGLRENEWQYKRHLGK